MKSLPFLLISLFLLACNPSRQVFNSLIDKFLAQTT